MSGFPGRVRGYVDFLELSGKSKGVLERECGEVLEGDDGFL